MEPELKAIADIAVAMIIGLATNLVFELYFRSILSKKTSLMLRCGDVTTVFIS